MTIMAITIPAWVLWTAGIVVGVPAVLFVGFVLYFGALARKGM